MMTATITTYCLSCDRPASAFCVAYHDTRTYEQPRPEQVGGETTSTIPASSDYDSEVGKWAISKPMTRQIIDNDLRRGKIGTMPIYSIDVPESDGRIHFGGVVVFGDEKRTERIVDAVNQHSILIAQRERLLEGLRLAVDWMQGRRGGPSEGLLAAQVIKRLESVITTSEQEGRTQR